MAATNDPAKNDEYVVNQRPESGEEKQTVREQDGGDHSSNVEENLCWQQNPGQMDGRSTCAGEKP